MKIALTSDWHEQLPTEYPSCDTIIHAGDIGEGNMRWYREKFFPWCEQFQGTIYATWGNHDWTQKIYHELAELAPDNLWLLVDDWINIIDRKVWFTPWSPQFMNWAWMLSEEQLAKKYKKIPKDTQVIVSHSPPWGLRDMTMRGEMVGSKELLSRMLDLPQLTEVICGHIHEGYGVAPLVANMRTPVVWNVSSVDERYRPRKERYTYVEW